VTLVVGLMVVTEIEKAGH